MQALTNVSRPETDPRASAPTVRRPKELTLRLSEPASGAQASRRARSCRSPRPVLCFVQKVERILEGLHLKYYDFPFVAGQQEHSDGMVELGRFDGVKTVLLTHAKAQSSFVDLTRTWTSME